MHELYADKYAQVCLSHFFPLDLFTFFVVFFF
jgi:hypothetical protein